MTGPELHDLDGLLAAWAETRRLPDAEADRIAAAIVPAVPTLSATWWTDFSSKLGTAVANATATPGPALAALGL